MRIPLIATYRLQLGRAFNFAQAAARVHYLKKLGISHLYLSPVLDAATGSLHGYDVVNHTQLAPGLGGDEGFAQLVQAAHSAGIGIVLDLVPNHMSIADGRNRWWWDVLENGPSSKWAHVFDVDWDPPEQRLKNVVLLPVLGDHLSEVLKAKQLRIEREAARFVVRYFEHRFPVAPRSLGMMLQHAATRCDEPRLGFLADAFAELPPPTAVDRKAVERRHRDKEVLRELLEVLILRSEPAAKAITQTLEQVNETPQMLDAMLELQNYRLSYWRSAERDLDYRRFFDINSLVGVRMEDPHVFKEAHALIEKLYLRGDIDGLRVDHVDGLADPAGYLTQLRALAPGATIHVEKILGKDEALPAWPVDGTTGYEHGAELTALFTDPAAEGPLKALNAELIGESPDFEVEAVGARQQVLRELLASDVNRLANLLVKLGERYWEVRDYTRHELKELVASIAASFPVYRTYVVPAAKGVSEDDKAVIARALSTARTLAPGLDLALFEFVGDLLMLRRTGAIESDFVSRFQQLTAPAMAKGVEDTAFYRYSTLVALAEVGNTPERFHLSLEAFHQRCEAARKNWPARLNATSTHDSKRSADVRARLVAMSQAPERFATLARTFFQRTEQYVTDQMPDRTLRMIALQTLVGAWPLQPARFQATLEKSAREAKTHTSWLHPNEKYDQALARFATAVMSDAVLGKQLDDYVLELLPRARAISLGWVLLKTTTPGVPDFYQGTEVWNFSLVDPDNRAAVNWRLRDQAIDDNRLPSVEADEVGLTKLFVIRRALQLRRERPELFGADAAYVPLEVTGSGAGAVVAFARAGKDGGHAVGVVGRWPKSSPEEWGDTEVRLPDGDFDSRFDDQRGLRHSVALSALFARLPVALLVSAQ